MPRHSKSISATRRTKPRVRPGAVKLPPSSTASKPSLSSSRPKSSPPLPPPVFDTSAVVECPYCGESVEITLDPSSGRAQRYVEDCAVCCRPWQVSLTYDDDGHADIYLATTDE